MDIGVQADSHALSRAVEILSATYAGNAATGKVPICGTGRNQDASDIVALNKARQILAKGE